MSNIADFAPLLLRKYYARRADKPRRKKLSRQWQNRLAALLLIAAIGSGLATYAALTETPPLGNDPDTVLWLLNLDLVLLLMLVALIAQRIVSLWSGRKRRLAGSHLQVRLVYTFSMLAAIPVIVMTIFSAFFFHYGVQTWFSERVKTAVNESQAVAQAYLEEHKQVIRADTLAMANDLDRQAAYLVSNDEAFEKIIQTQSLLRNLTEAIVFDNNGRVLARSGLTFSLEFEQIPEYAMRQAREGEVVIMTGGNDDRVRALIKLNNFIDTFLFVGRMVDPQVLSHLVSTQQASQDYADLQARYSDLQVIFSMIFVVVGLLLLLAAIWFGIVLARQLVSPIGTLITTADRVRAGDLAARVPYEGNLEEFEYLAKSFNRMTKQIQEQQSELIDANRQLDRRRRFTETVLAGVSSGIIGLDAEDKVNLANNAACKMMSLEGSDIEGSIIGSVMPEVDKLLAQAHARPSKVTQGEISFQQADGTKRTFYARIAIELIGDMDVGAIITFDDMTEIQSAQRKAAWADVARRIAHEIKNPLTPIQLSAERLKRKYLKHITDDQETFSQCTDTIVKHVRDIERMVNEFSSFARMPEPVMKQGNLSRHIRETLILHQQAHPDIRFNFIAPDHENVRAMFDGQQVRQALTNLLQNAVDSIQLRIEGDTKKHGKAEPGHVDIVLAENAPGEMAVIITDNGQGLPAHENPVHLTEPYVTHKPKGTGLGLAIVKKIMEDHGGELALGEQDWLKSIKSWRSMKGATVSLIFPRDREELDNAA